MFNIFGGLRLGRILGIDVYLHPTWFIIVAIVSASLSGAFTEMGVATGATSFFLATATAVTIFATLLAHEYGHALAARWFGIETERITLFFLGGVAHIKDEPHTPGQEFIVAIAGPAVSGLAMVLFGALYLLGGALEWPLVLTTPLYIVAIANGFLLVFNMIPAFPMDGGRVLRSAAWALSGDYLKASSIACMGGRIFGWFLIIAGAATLINGNVGGITWILMGMFLNWLAKASLNQARYRAAFEPFHVRDFMRPVQVVVPAELPLAAVVREFFHRLHGDRFPVVRGQSLLGFISAADVHDVDRALWQETRAERIARPADSREMLDPGNDIASALRRLASLGRPQLPVFNGQQLVGFLFLRDVMNHLRQTSQRAGAGARQVRWF